MKQYVTELLSQALTDILDDQAQAILPGLSIDVTIPQEQFGDYSSNVALLAFKSLKEPFMGGPQALASTLAAKAKELDHKDTFSKIESVGGFINFTLSAKFLAHRLGEVLQQAGDYGKPDSPDSRTVIVEYFQNNVAKPPHIGHLRSAVVGDALKRIFTKLGYDTISDTHIGDWGVQFGILIYAYKTNGDQEQIKKDPINELNKLYVDISAQMESSPELRELGKAEFKKLEDGDKENRQLWQWFVDVSKKDFERYQAELKLLPFNEEMGESDYESMMPEVLKQLQDKGLVKTGEDGEQYVDLEDQGLGRCILVKSDGATTYHLRDFATYIYRKDKFNFYRNLYVVDNRQSHHFRQLFAVLQKAGYPAETDSVHVDLGFMSLPEGAISTRKGNVIPLQGLIDEAHKRALAIIEEKNPDLHDKSSVAKQVALAAIKYFDLSHNRKTEIVFQWDNALSFEGNTGPYLQYTHARINGILRKAKAQDHAPVGDNAAQITHDLEKQVLRKLHQFPEALQAVSRDYLPNILAHYLFELAQTFNGFYQAVPVLQEENEQTRNFRLNLIRATAQVIKNGLELLGIEAPKEM